MNTKQTEALKLALEGAANYIDPLGGDSRKYRQALSEQPANVAAVNTSSERVDKTEENVHEQPAQQHIEHCIWARNGNAPCPHVQPAQQEPVAIGRVRLDAGEVHIHPLVRDADKAGLVEGQPVYTSPQPSKPWQGLTDEERDSITRSIQGGHGSDTKVARAIETKLREKNA